MNYVIIGNSAAAIGCVEGIRQRDGQGAITLIAAEPHHTYSRPLISYLLAGKTDRERMRYRPEDFYKATNCTALLGETATAIHPEKKLVELQNSRTIPYGKLLIATGSRPFLPPIPGLDTVPSHSAFLTLEDALTLQQTVTPATRVLILGAGLIGLKCAEGLLHLTPRITVVEGADHILPSVLDREDALPFQKKLEGEGVRLMLGRTVESFQGNTATLSGGEALEFDQLIVAAGVRPNNELVKEAGGQVDRGIVIDENGRTSLPDIYAAGDCTQCRELLSGENRVLALLPNAYLQGESAGIHMAGGEKPFNKAIAMNAMGLLGLHLVSAGNPTGREYREECPEGSKRLWVDEEGDRLTGFRIIGDISRAGIYTSLIRDQIPLSTIDFELIKAKPQLMAFSRKERARKLGGVPV